MEEKISYMQGEPGNPGASYDGEFFEADENGIIQVPSAAVPELIGHGFTPRGKPEEQDETKKRIAELTAAVKAAKETLKNDKGNADLKAQVDVAEKALADFKESIKKV